MILLRPSSLLQMRSAVSATAAYYSSNLTKNVPGEEEFRTLDLVPKKSHMQPRKKRFKALVRAPRCTEMKVDQDWPSVWPTARTFNPSVVPLPLYQGYINPKHKRPPPGKFANAELMKIPNFLHLTPPAIKQHCEVLKRFCTPWPTALSTDELCEQHFPLEVISSDYCHSSPSIRDPRARIVTFKVRLSRLRLDEHAKDKFLRLVGDRYDVATDVVTLVSERCPLKKQNYDYACYLLAVLCSESRKVEPWEAEKSEADMEKYVWEGSTSEKSIQSTLKRMEKVEDRAEISQYANAVTELHNEGENPYTLTQYREAVLGILGLDVNLEKQQL